MSDHIEVDGKKYFEQSYLQGANATSKRRGKERDEARTLIAKMAEALRDLVEEYDYQTEHRYCVCGSDDSGNHSTACLRQMKVLDGVGELLSSEAAQAALAEREALLAVVAAARCIRHWHDTGMDGMVVSREHVYKLWDALGKLNAATGQKSEKPG